jgi:hypothetical protein
LRTLLERKQIGEAIKADIDQRKKDTQQQLQALRWVLGPFDPQQRVVPQAAYATRLFHDWRRSHDAYRDKFLFSVSKSRGDIASGKALNFFLELCGPVALKQSIYRQRDILRAQQAPAGGVPAAAEEPLVQNLAHDLPLRPDEVARIRWRRGLTGPPEEGRLGAAQELLPLDWPATLRNDPRLDEARQAVEDARHEIVVDLRQGRPLARAAGDGLMRAVDELTRQADAVRQADVNKLRQRVGEPGVGPDPVLLARYADRKFLSSLRYNVYHFIAARDPREHGAIEPFEQDSAEELMAYFSRNGLWFAPAGSEPQAQVVYEKLFKLMTWYYIDLCALEAAEAGAANELQRLERIDERVIDARLFPLVENLNLFVTGENPDPASLAVPLRLPLPAPPIRP